MLLTVVMVQCEMWVNDRLNKYHKSAPNKPENNHKNTAATPHADDGKHRCLLTPLIPIEINDVKWWQRVISNAGVIIMMMMYDNNMVMSLFGYSPALDVITTLYSVPSKCSFTSRREKHYADLFFTAEAHAQVRRALKDVALREIESSTVWFLETCRRWHVSHVCVFCLPGQRFWFR